MVDSSPEMHRAERGLSSVYGGAHHQQQEVQVQQTHVFAPPVTGAPVKSGKYGSSSHDIHPTASTSAASLGPTTGSFVAAPSASSQQLSSSSQLIPGSSSSQLIPGQQLIPSSSSQQLIPSQQLLPSQQLIPTSRFPATNAEGQRICRQCGQPGRIKDGKCVEKWGPGPLGPGTVCDRCRKKMKRVERRGTLESQQQAQAQQQQAQLAAAASLSSLPPGSSFSSPGSSNRITGASYDRNKVQRSDTVLVNPNSHSHSSLPPPHSPRLHAHHPGHIRDRDRDRDRERDREHHHGHHHHSSPPQPHPIPHGAPTQILERDGSTRSGYMPSSHHHPHGGSSYSHGHSTRPEPRERERDRGYDDERERDGATDGPGSRSRNNSGSTAPSPVHRSNSRSSTAAKQPGDLKLPPPVDYRQEQRYHRSRQGTPSTAPIVAAIATIPAGGEDELEEEEGVEAELDADADADADPEVEDDVDEITHDTHAPPSQPVQAQTGAHGNPYPVVNPHQRKQLPPSSSLRREQQSSPYSSYHHQSAPGSRRRSPEPEYRTGRPSAGNHHGARKDQREERTGSDDVDDVLLEAVDAAEKMSATSDGAASPDSSRDYDARSMRRERTRGNGGAKDEADEWLREAAGV